MTPFLKQVAEYYYSAGNIGNRCFVFPNRRSMVFFTKYLTESVAADPQGRPLLAPQMHTINDFFYKVGGSVQADRVKLLIDLYDCYSKLNPRHESLDDFIFWGDVILGDFNDIDKYLIDPEQLFTNVSDYRQIQDTFSYLTDTQREAIESFLSNFSDKNGRLTVDLDSDNPAVKERFLLIWNILLPLYKEFNKLLSSKGAAYEGMAYRALADRLKGGSVSDVMGEHFQSDTVFVFVGMNTLNECEKLLLRKLRDASRAEFCWDYAGPMISDPKNRSSLFMDANVREFPQVAGWNKETLPVPQINVLSVPSSVGQAKRIPDILKSVRDTESCAIVLPDENLLLPVLNSIPPHVKDINVTMGLPMRNSLLFSMMEVISAMQLHTTFRRGKWHFYHKQVWDLFSNILFRNALGEDSRELVRKVKHSAKYYIPQEDLNGTPLMDAVFRPVISDSKKADSAQVSQMAEYQKEVIARIAPTVADDPRLALELEYAKEYYKGINMLQDSLCGGDQERALLPVTYIRLLAQILGATSVPFKGEPLRGLQIMGPLETRALDFDDVVIMSANEGVFPHRNVSSSFIPPELRRGFGLPTYELQDAIWAYYFYRMISRARNVWMLVDSRSEGLKSGEESRYIKQLEYHFGVRLNRYVLKLESMKAAELPEIVKTAEDIDAIKSGFMSATALQNYLSCPAKFYYSVVKGLQNEDEVSETLDYGMFGTIYHEVMRSLYTSEEAMAEDFSFKNKGEKSLRNKLSHVTRAYIRNWLEREDEIKRKVRALIISEMNAVEVNGRNLVVTDVLVKYIMKTLRTDLKLLEDAGKDSFEIIGREIVVKGDFHGFSFVGFIDRLDAFDKDQVRVVDYKTGAVLDEDFMIEEYGPVEVADKIFAPDIQGRPKIAFQFYIYDLLLQGREDVKGRKIHNCIYSTSRLFRELPQSRPLNNLFFDRVTENLEKLLDEICDPQVNFRRTSDEKMCSYCDFKTICGR